jgi:thiamine pyrophosphate-dependent acetolactate synthase large subunit-like protein
MMDMLEATQALCRRLAADVPVVASLGNPGLNLFNADPARTRNFYFRNAMGVACSMALGLATALPEKRVVLLDGDGSLLMNLSSLASEAWRAPRNLLHVCWDNRMYEMTGKQPTATSGPADLAAMAEGAGFPHAERVETLAAFEAALERALREEGPWFIQAIVSGERAKRDPQGPKSPTEIRQRFQDALAG